jgi:predicted PurR-regulated permease PerM
MPQMPNTEPYWNSDRKMQLLFAACGFAAFFALLYYLSDVLTPFAVAFLLAYILNPIVNILQKKVKHRWIACLLMLFALLLIGIGAAFIFIPMVIEQGMNLGRLLQKYANDSALKEYLHMGIWAKIQYIWEERDVKALFDKLMNMDVLKVVQGLLEKIMSSAMGVFSGIGRVFAWFIGFFMIALCLVFMLLDFENIRKKLSDQIPAKHSETILRFFQTFDGIMSKYFRAQTSIAGIVGILFAISFSIMGLPMGLTFGLFIGMLNMVPYLQVASIPIAVFLGLIYSLETGLAFWQVLLIITAIYAGVQVLQDMFITPRIMGGALGLSPVLILLSLAVWGKLLGFLGFVLAIPFTCVAIAIYKSLRGTNSKGNYEKL